MIIINICILTVTGRAGSEEYDITGDIERDAPSDEGAIVIEALQMTTARQ